MIPVALHRRTNKDKTITLSLRYIDPATEMEVKSAICRTEANPSKTRLRSWEAIARDAIYQLRKEFQGEPRRTEVKYLNLAKGLDLYIDWCQEIGPHGQANIAPSTLNNRITHITSLLDFIRRKAKADGKRRAPGCMHLIFRYYPAQWRDSMIHDGLAPGTINSRLSSCAAWWGWAVDHGYSHANPIGEIRRVPTMKGKRALLRFKEAEDIAEIIGAMDTLEKKAAIVLLAHTGIRHGEARSLTWDCIAGDVLSIPEYRETTKIHCRDIPMTAKLQESLEMLESLGRKPYILGGPAKLTSQLNTWLRPHKATPHDFRRFFITNMEGVGAPTTVIDDLAGHSPGKVRAAYTPKSNLKAARPWIRKFGAWMEE